MFDHMGCVLCWRAEYYALSQDAALAYCFAYTLNNSVSQLAPSDMAVENM